jgi:hypothetical protein
MAQNELEKTFNKVLDQKVMPEFKKILDKLNEMDNKFKIIIDIAKSIKLNKNCGKINIC